MTFGAIEAGGTKWVCAVGSDRGELLASTTIPTTSPAETIERATTFLLANGPLMSVGVGSFGPLDLDPHSPTWGSITTTPKPGWRNVPLLAHLTDALGVRVAIDTDVNAAALGEHRFGAARGLHTFCYLTIGTGIGGGNIVGGELAHGLLHPEIGHLQIPHDRLRDPFDGICPFHGDCFEGLASGEAMRARWGTPAPEIQNQEAWDLEAEYIALGILNVVCVLSPQRMVVGGGVMHHPQLLRLVCDRVRHIASGFLVSPELAENVTQFVVSPELGDRSGVIGALELARRVADTE